MTQEDLETVEDIPSEHIKNQIEAWKLDRRGHLITLHSQAALEEAGLQDDGDRQAVEAARQALAKIDHGIATLQALL